MNRLFVIEIHFLNSLSEKQKQFEKELAEVNARSNFKPTACQSRNNSLIL